MELRSASSETIRPTLNRWTHGRIEQAFSKGTAANASQGDGSGGLLELFDSVFRQVSAPPPPEPASASDSAAPDDSVREETDDNPASDDRNRNTIDSQRETKRTSGDENHAAEIDASDLPVPSAPVDDEVVAEVTEESADDLEPGSEAIAAANVDDAEAEPVEEELINVSNADVAAAVLNAQPVAETDAAQVDTGDAVAVAQADPRAKRAESLGNSANSPAAMPIAEPKAVPSSEQSDLTATASQTEESVEESIVSAESQPDDSNRRVGARYRSKAEKNADAGVNLSANPNAAHREANQQPGPATTGRPAAESTLSPAMTDPSPPPPTTQPTVMPTPVVNAAAATAAAMRAIREVSSASETSTRSSGVDAVDGPTSSASTSDPATKTTVPGTDKTAGDKTIDQSNAIRVRLVQRVSRAFQRIGPDGGRINMMLHPAELGSVRLDLRVDGKHMNARLVAASEAAIGVLRESLPELKLKLADSGIVVDKIEVELAGREGSQRHDFGSDQQSDRRFDQRDENWMRQRRQQTEPASVTPPTPVNAPTRTFGQPRGPLNLIV